MTYNIPLDVKVVDPSTTSNRGVPRDVRIVDADGNAAQLIFDNLTATTAPTANDDSDDNYTVGSCWVDVTADKAYICVDATVGSAVWQEVAATIVDPLVYKGTIDCTLNPDYPAGDAGHTYVVNGDGKIGGASGEDVYIGDMIICNTDGSVGGTEAAVGTEWDTMPGNSKVVVGPSSSTDNSLPLYNGITGKIIDDSEIVVTGGANTFVMTKGTAVLDIAASSNVNIDGNLAVESASAINQDLTSDATPTFAGLALGVGSITMSGSIGVTGTRVTKGWFTDLEVTNAIAGSVTGNAGTVTNGVYTSSQVTVLAAADAADKDKYLHANASTGALEWSTVSSTPTAITVADEASDTTCFPLFVTAATGDLGPKTNANLIFNSSNGNFGLGGTPDRSMVINTDTNPLAAGQASLMIYGANNKERIELKSTIAPVYGGVKINGTIASPTATAANNPLLYFGGGGHDGTNYTVNKAYNVFYAAENFTPTQQGTYITWETTLIGGVLRAEKMRLTDAGNLGIGTTAPENKVDINSATGACLQLTYNDSDGTASNKVNFAVGSTGNLTITPSGGDISLAGNTNVTGNCSASTAFVPDANDGAALGTTALQFSDLFLAEGGVINWDNGDATLTQTGNTIALAGATLTVGSDTDEVVTLGRAKIGYQGSFSDYASFGHLDYVATNGYAIAQNAGGTTFIKSNDLLYVSSNGFSHNGLVTKPYSGELADDATIALATGVSGILEVWEDTEHLRVKVGTDGAITSIYGSANTAVTDSDGNLCVYDGGSGAVIKNALGSSKTVRYIFNYS